MALHKTLLDQEGTDGLLKGLVESQINQWMPRIDTRARKQNLREGIYRDLHFDINGKASRDKTTFLCIQTSFIES